MEDHKIPFEWSSICMWTSVEVSTYLLYQNVFRRHLVKPADWLTSLITTTLTASTQKIIQTIKIFSQSIYIHAFDANSVTPTVKLLAQPVPYFLNQISTQSAVWKHLNRKSSRRSTQKQPCRWCTALSLRTSP